MTIGGCLYTNRLHARTVIEEYGLETVQTYMRFIKENAEFAVRNLLRKAVERAGKNVLHAVDYMDDGSPIELTITIDADKGSAVFDFEGTSPESRSSLNAPLAVCSSAVIYCLRILVDEEVRYHNRPAARSVPPDHTDMVPFIVCCRSRSMLAASLPSNSRSRKTRC